MRLVMQFDSCGFAILLSDEDVTAEPTLECLTESRCFDYSDRVWKTSLKHVHQVST
jgi:hypothetical protein